MEVLLNKLFDKHSEGYGVYDRENLIKDICKEYQALQLQRTASTSLLPYNEKVLMHLWYNRNPSREMNTNTKEDMFWKTAFMVMQDYVREIGGNDR